MTLPISVGSQAISVSMSNVRNVKDVARAVDEHEHVHVGHFGIHCRKHAKKALKDLWRC
jgi:hypothetical protein